MPRRDRPRSSWTQKVLVVTLALAVAGSTMAIATRSNEYEFFDPLIDVRSMLQKYYVAETSDTDLQTAAINGMIEALGDPYTAYVPPRDREDFSKDLTGEYVGIGAEVGLRDGWLTILSPLDDSPAWKAGVMADDRVIAINGQSTAGNTVDESIDMLKGEPGTPVTLTIERSTGTVDIQVIRDHIKTLAVKGVHREAQADGKWDFWIDPKLRIAYIRLVQFTPGAAAEVRSVLEQLGADQGNLGGLVLDLRWNPGGLLDEAVELADMFLQDGVIVSTRGRSIEQRVSRAKPEGTLPDFPIAVLLNAQSASASEVLAGALSENNRAIVVGTRSFGKGSVQSVRPLPSLPEAVLKITEQGYDLPSGRSIQRKDGSAVWGVDPTPGYLVTLTEDQLIELLTRRREEEILRSTGTPSESANWNDAQWILDRFQDPQLTAAVEAMQAKIRTGEWLPTGKDEPGIDDAAAAELATSLLARERLIRQLARLDGQIDALEAGLNAPVQMAGDLWADDVDLEDGTIQIRDAQGNVVATLRITGPDLERWLIDADVEPAEPVTP